MSSDYNHFRSDFPEPVTEKEKSLQTIESIQCLFLEVFLALASQSQQQKQKRVFKLLKVPNLSFPICFPL